VTALLDALAASFAATLKNPEGVAPPAALVWTDADGQWRELAPRLRSALPQVFQLGDYEPAQRVGPSIWLKCVVARKVDEGPPAGIAPILYLPGVSRQTLRANGDCPPELQPLIELQFRGRVWHQTNGRDWTVEAFLTSGDGLGLDVAGDARTREALLRALPLLADADLDALRGRRLDEGDFNRLAVSDPERDLLRWIADPDVFRAGLDAGRWESFRQVCRAQFKLDPDDATPAEAARWLATGGGEWEHAWRRFREAPRLYRGVARQLREPAAAPDYLLADPSRQPGRNDEEEARLRKELATAAGLPHHEACARVLALESEQGVRRDWVWAELGESPFALVLEPLARLAGLARSPLGGATLDSIVGAYADGGWRADRAAIDAIAAAARLKDHDRDLVAGVVRTLYLPWLDASARRFQEVVGERADGLRGLVTAIEPERETCLVFADGLRFDVASLVQAKLDSLAFRTRLGFRMAPLPTVTPTAKPAAAPLPALLHGKGAPESFAPVLSASGLEATAPRLRDTMAGHGVEVLDKDDTRVPAGTSACGWTEVGELDALGHKLGVGLAVQVDDEAERIAARVAELLEAGWSRVRVVTDHGWLLVPGGLPKVDLPAHLVATRWARCAMVRGNAAPDMPTYPWHWNPEARIASPPGAGAFASGYEYAHGGVSPQECVVPDLVAERGAVRLAARIESIKWLGMRCRITVAPADPTIRVDLRTKRRLPETSLVAQVKELGGAAEVSLAVEDDSNEGATAAVVLLDGAGNVVDHMTTTVGQG
jgi:hypothetical protein